MTPTQHHNRPSLSITFLILAVTFTVCLIISNLIEIKTVTIGPLYITAGFIIFPLSYIINDCIVEVYGFARARLVIWIAFAMNLLVSLILQLAIALPSAPTWHHQHEITTVFGAVPRILAASFIAFLAGSMINATIMSRMKTIHGPARHFGRRAILSSLAGEALDSSIFFPLAFAGTLPATAIITLIATQTILKTLYEIIILPITRRAVIALKNHEGSEITDTTATTYSWWQINDFN